MHAWNKLELSGMRRDSDFQTMRAAAAAMLLVLPLILAVTSLIRLAGLVTREHKTVAFRHSQSEQRLRGNKGRPSAASA
jgi:hypothetical protein